MLKKEVPCDDKHEDGSSNDQGTKELFPGESHSRVSSATMLATAGQCEIPLIISCLLCIINGVL